MQILIVTAPCDADAISIETVLRAKGVDAHRVFLSELGHSSDLSYKLSSNVLDLTAADGELARAKPDVVWVRKPRPPKPPLDMDEQDTAAVHAENVNAAHAILHSWAKDARMVNPMKGREFGRSKVAQLRCALEIGFKVPETLITNQKADVIAFIEKDNQPTIFKTFAPVRYHDGGNFRPVYATQITATDLADEPDRMHQVSIFQKRVEKSFEIRALFLGSYVVAVRLETQLHENSSVDSRRAAPEGVQGSYIELPDAVKMQCVELMQTMDIETASFDLIVTPEGDYVFLEFNETGQCLYLEQYEGVPRVLEAYCQFLMHNGNPFMFEPDWNKARNSSLEHAAASHAIAMKENKQYHSRVSEVTALRL